MGGVMWPIAALVGAAIGFGVCLLLVWRFSRLASDMTRITQRQASLEEVESLKADLAKLRADCQGNADEALQRFQQTQVAFQSASDLTPQSLNSWFAQHLHFWSTHQHLQALAAPGEPRALRPHDDRYLAAATACNADLAVLAELKQRLQ